MTDGQAKPAGTPGFDAKARAAEIRRAARQRNLGEPRRGLPYLSGANLIVLLLVGVLAVVVLATLVLGLPLSMVGGKAVVILPVILLCLFMRGGREL